MSQINDAEEQFEKDFDFCPRCNKRTLTLLEVDGFSEPMLFCINKECGYPHKTQ